jgi:hypothetical protein
MTTQFLQFSATIDSMELPIENSDGHCTEKATQRDDIDISFGEPDPTEEDPAESRSGSKVPTNLGLHSLNL